MARVAAEARAALVPGRGPLVIPARLRIVYFHMGTPVGDIDNKIKLISDSLNGIAYDDDKRVVDVRAVMQDQNGTFLIPNLTPALAGALGAVPDMVYVEVDPFNPLEPIT